MKIGLIGAANSHARQFAQALNAEKRHPGYAVTHLFGEDDPAAAEALCAGYGLARCQSEAEVVEQCDAVVVTYRKGSQHGPAVMLALQAGKAVFNDKPFATSPKQAAEMVACAKAHGGLLCGGSSLKSMPALGPVKAGVKAGTVVHILFSADPASPYDGYWFYGMHSVELCLELCGIHWQWERAVRNGETVTATVAYADKTCILTTRPDFENLHIAVANGGDCRLFSPALSFETIGTDELVAMLQSGKPPRSYDFYLRAVELLHAIESQLAET